jgi:preprotein translocase subunit SecG
MLSVIIVIHLMLVIALIGVVLLQKSEGGGLISSTSGFLTGRGTANALSRTTALLAAGFFVTSLALSWLASYEHRPVAVINTSGAPTEPAPPGPAGGPPPAAPLSPGNGGLLNQLQKGIPGLPSGSNPNFAPEPSGPQVPQSK